VKALRGVQVTKEVGVVVVGDGTRVVDAKGVEEVAKGESVIKRVLCLLKGEVNHGCGGMMLALCDLEEGDVVCDTVLKR
jgi:hypothetical protein